MEVRFFIIDVLEPEQGQEILDKFCRQHRVSAIERHLIMQEQRHFWAVCVTYHRTQGQTAPPRHPSNSGSNTNNSDRIDYRQILNEADFALFAKLRTLRKELADSANVPAYALFTNAQLAEIVTKKINSLTDLAKIEGVGASRIEKYGQVFLAALQNMELSPETPTDHA